MTRNSAWNFLTLGTAFIIIDMYRRFRAAQFFIVIAGLGALLALIGYLYGVEAFYRIPLYGSIALHTAITFLILCLGLLFAGAEHGAMATLTSESAGGILARRLLPAAVLIPIVLGWFRLLGENAGLYNPTVGLALSAVSNIVVLVALIVWSARSLEGFDGARRQAEGKLRELYTKLEERVQERTAQLTEVNQRLQSEVAEHERTGAALRESSERLEFFFENSLLGVLVTAPDGKILDANLEACRILGWTKSELRELGRSGVVDVTDPRLMLALQERARTGKFKGEITMLRQGSIKFPVEVFTAVYRNQAGDELTSMLIIDITERKQAEVALRESEAKLRAVFDVLPVGISIMDHDRHVIETNPALERILGVSKQGLAAGEYATRTYVRPDGAALPLQDLPSVRALQAQQTVLNVEMGVIMESGHTVWTSVSAAPIPLSNAGVVVVTNDLTERRRGEEALAEERDLLQALLDNIPDSIYFKDATSRFTRINRAQARVLGVSDPQQAIGKTDADFQPTRLSTDFYAEEQELIHKGTPIIDRQEYNPTADGQPRWFSATKVPLRDKQGQVIGLIGISRDITGRIESEKAIVESNAQLTERVREISLLNELEEQLQACVATPEVYQVTAGSASRLFPTETGRLYVINNSRNRMDAAAAWGDTPAAPEAIQLNDCWALRRGRVHISGVGSTNLVCPHLKGAVPSFSICIPLTAHSETLGCLHFHTPAGTLVPRWDEAKQQLAGVVADCIALAMANLNLREKLRQQSIRDPLTDLFNRRYMEESLERELSRAARNKSSVGIVMLDVDHFKRINDAHGHDTGDAVLRQLSRFLKKYTRGGDIACRFGGEEFTLILPDASLQETRQRLEHMRTEFKTISLKYGERVIDPVTLSFGVASYPEHGNTGADVLRAADAAMYRAKHEGRDRVVIAE